MEYNDQTYVLKRSGLPEYIGCIKSIAVKVI